MQTLNWGIMGTGNIARQFAEGVAGSQRGRTVACASRDAEKAAAFARTHGLPGAGVGAHAGYAALLGDPSVKAVYIALPNSMHKEWAIRALEAGKHVLCEKPLAASAAEAEEMFDAARRTGRLLVEAFMYRSHPLTAAVLSAIRGGAIGRVKLIRSSFCYYTAKAEGNIRFRADLAGGSLMDVGCYCLSFSRLMAGAEPTGAFAAGHLHGSGVDDFAAGTLVFPPPESARDRVAQPPSAGWPLASPQEAPAGMSVLRGAPPGAAVPHAGAPIIATFSCGMTIQAPNAAYIAGDGGYIEIPVPWKPPQKKAVYIVGYSTPPRMDGNRPPPPDRQTFEVDAPGPLYGLEADDFAAAVDGAPVRVTREDSLGNMRLLDALRRQVGALGA